MPRSLRLLVSILVIASLTACKHSTKTTSAGGSGGSTHEERTPPPPSVARIWDEALLDAIRRDTPRPGVHARNLFHTSVAMYDAWAVYAGKESAGYLTKYKIHRPPQEIPYDRAEAISFAAYRILTARFLHSPGVAASQLEFDNTMASLGYDKNNTSTDGDSPAAVGNRIAQTVLAYGLLDGSNESANYADPTYKPVNDPLIVKLEGTTQSDPNRWQPLAFDYFVTQNGIPVGALTQTFIGSQWGKVLPFAMKKGLGEVLYHDPGQLYRLDPVHPETSDEFREDVVTIIRLSSQLTPDDGEYMDISPGAFGNNPLGTDAGTGYPVNPVTGEPYPAQPVKRGDFGRVLAEFWADGPHSETPPGHWNVIANYVSDQPSTVKKVGGMGRDVDPLEWDVKLYFALNGAVHDAAVACWGTKRHYDGSRPISMVRYMGGKGQSSDPELPSYDPEGLPLIDGLIELITPATTAPGQHHENLAGHEGEIAVYAWKGNPADPITQAGGVGWILAIDWFPYQLGTFVTPAFPGYTSGHSTFSRSAAEVLTAFTGSPWFPGGLGDYNIAAGTGLKFEYGPSEDVDLQWASYFDAADQAGLSRQYGGIHVNLDDKRARIMGSQIGKDAWALAERYFSGDRSLVPPEPQPPDPSPVGDAPTIPKVPVTEPAYTMPAAGQCSVVAQGTYRTSPPVPSCTSVSNACNGAGGVVIETATSSIAPTAGAYFHVDTTESPDNIEVRVNGEQVPLLFKDPDDDSRGAIYTLPRPAGLHLPQCPVQISVRLNGALEDDDCRQMEIVRPHFEDVADVMGLTFTHTETGDPQPYATGIGFGDFDNDGDQDLYLPNFSGFGIFFKNTGDTNNDAIPDFVDATADVGLSEIDKGASAVFVDYDNDGDRDLFIGRQGDSLMFQNQLIESGTATFTDVTSAVGLSDIKARVAGQAWGDFDGDGDLDLYLSTHVNSSEPVTTYRDHLYRNDSGVFLDITDSTLTEQVAGSHPTALIGFAAMWIDVDGDGDLDLMVTSDDIENSDLIALGIVRPNVLWRNDGPGALPNTWIFTDVTEDSGWAYLPDAKGQGINAMGLSAGDLNRDGKPDFAMSNIGPNYLLRNTTSPSGITFVDISDAAGIRRTYFDWQPETPGDAGPLARRDMSITWGTNLFDADADGDLDLFYAGGSGLQVFGPRPVPSAFFVNNGSNVFADNSMESGTTDDQSATSTALVDIDHDGFQDLAVANVNGKFRFYLNVTPQNGNTNHWLQVDLAGTVSNRDALGSVVKVKMNNNQVQTCWVVNTNGMGSGSELTCNFGLGADTSVQDIQIQWPDGTITHPSLPSVDSRILCKEPGP